MKKTISIILAAVLALSCIFGFAACSSGSKGITIAVPNDATNEARALLLLQEQGIIKLKDGAGITATVRDIEDNPKNITFKEVEAAQLPNVLKDVDYAVINSNYAISAGLNPVKDNLAIEGSSSAYSNILAAKKGNENSDKIKALSAALQSKKVADFIASKYNGAVISVVSNPGDGYDPSVNYDALKGQTITVAHPPHRTPRSSPLPRRSLPLRASPLTSKSSKIMSSPTMLLSPARSTQTTSSTSLTSTISTSRTTRTSSPFAMSTSSPWLSTAASRPLLTQ